MTPLFDKLFLGSLAICVLVLTVMMAVMTYKMATDSMPLSRNRVEVISQ